MLVLVCLVYKSVGSSDCHYSYQSFYGFFLAGKKKKISLTDIWIFCTLAVKHPYPFNDQVVIYIRHIGPGVLVGQAWQEGKELQQIPQKLCGEILMVKDHSANGETKWRSGVNHCILHLLLFSKLFRTSVVIKDFFEFVLRCLYKLVLIY